MSTLAEHRKTDSTPRSEPWLELPGAQAQGSDVLIIGAGLAGSSTAYSLAQRGWNVTVIDAGTKDSGAASKNAYMALRCRLFNSSSAEASFFLHGYHFALRQFSELKRHSNINWNPCGVVQLDLAMNKKKPLQAEKIRELYSDSIVKLIDRNTASAEAGLELSDQAWHFPAGGSMDPASLCAAYLDHPRIRTLQDTSVDRLSKRGERWFASVNDRDIATGDVVVIANSFGATEFEQASFLPLQRLRGQTTNVEQSEKSATLKCIVSGLRSVYPASGGQHLISASYHISSELGFSQQDQKENLEQAAGNFRTAGLISNEAKGDRVSLRCNSPDRLPIIGPIPDMEKMCSTYKELSRNAKARFSTPGHYVSGLYVNVAHGSNGLASCPLGAELLASMITGENLPLNREIVNRLNPVRFLISDLKKQRA